MDGHCIASCILVDLFSRGKAFEQSIENGLIDVALDLSLVERVDFFVNGGATSSGKDRLKPAAKKEIPQMIGAANGLGQLTALFLINRMAYI